MPTLTQLQGAVDHHQLAALFGLKGDELLEGLYKRRRGKRFLVPKKSGGYRQVVAPRGVCRVVQSGLKAALDSVYRAPVGVHGFVAGRSVVTNAEPHVRRRTVINLDLENFFDTVDFYRVRGLFLSRPFSLSWVTANILAHACTYRGALMTGGIVSPVISNLISVGLDKRLGRLAGRYGGRYSRYADDITFSFAQPISALKEFASTNEQALYEIGGRLGSEIAQEGFRVNPSKFRVETGVSRKAVTGLVVNKRVNVPRKWIRALESKIYAVEKFGLDKVCEDYYSAVNLELARPMLQRHLHGQVAYLSMVRGKTDWVVAALAHRLNALEFGPMLKVPDIEEISRPERAALGCWVVAAGDDADLYEPPNGNGTAFTFQKGLLVTAYHVVDCGSGDPYPVITVRRHEKPAELMRCDFVAGCPTRDIAILRLSDPRHDLTRIRHTASNSFAVGERCSSIGFPNYFPGHVPTNHEHRISAVVVASGVRKLRLTGGAVLGGMSGGPVYDDAMQVVGIIHRGLANGGMADEAISVDHVISLIP